MAKSYHIVLVDRDHMALTIVNLKINVRLKLHKQTGFMQKNVIMYMLIPNKNSIYCGFID